MVKVLEMLFFEIGKKTIEIPANIANAAVIVLISIALGTYVSFWWDEAQRHLEYSRNDLRR